MRPLVDDIAVVGELHEQGKLNGLARDAGVKFIKELVRRFASESGGDEIVGSYRGDEAIASKAGIAAAVGPAHKLLILSGGIGDV